MISPTTPNGRRLVETYLAHVAGGVSLRTLARNHQVAPSTILRQVRRVEVARDNPLLDVLLDAATQRKDFSMLDDLPLVDAAATPGFCAPILRHLSKPDVCAIAGQGGDMLVALIIRRAPGRGDVALEKVARDKVLAAAAQGWVKGVAAQGFTSYTITDQGRAAAARLARQGSPVERLAAKARNIPAAALSATAQDAAQAVFEAYELAALEAPGLVDWDAVAAGAATPSVEDCRQLPAQTRRLVQILRHLGPDLAHIVLAVACRRLGLEESERALGWSARSGKIVLRIALDRVAQVLGLAKGQWQVPGLAE